MSSTFTGCKISSLFGNANSANSLMVSNSQFDKCVRDSEEEYNNMGADVPL